MTTNIDLCNRALAMAGTRSQITDLVSTAEGLYCGLLYGEFRDYLLRTGDYDFSIVIALPVSPAVSGPPWAYRSNRPADCVRVRQLMIPAVVVLDPQPISWNVTQDTIFANMVFSQLLYTSNLVAETSWDAVFTDAFVRLLSSGLAFALENRIEAHKLSIQEALEFATQGALINP